MRTIRTLLELIFQRVKMNIFRRILRTALWGSCVTFVVMGGFFWPVFSSCKVNGSCRAGFFHKK